MKKILALVFIVTLLISTNAFAVGVKSDTKLDQQFNNKAQINHYIKTEWFEIPWKIIKFASNYFYEVDPIVEKNIFYKGKNIFYSIIFS